MAKKKAEDTGGGAVSFEKELSRLEEIVARLEEGIPGLDESIKLYEQGVASLKACQKRLAEAEARIRALVEGASGPEEASLQSAGTGEGQAAPPKSRASGRKRRARPPRGTGLF
jgi:exodeoxyribonuclease VII small subunit